MVSAGPTLISGQINKLPFFDVFVTVRSSWLKHELADSDKTKIVIDAIRTHFFILPLLLNVLLCWSNFTHRKPAIDRSSASAVRMPVIRHLPA